LSPIPPVGQFEIPYLGKENGGESPVLHEILLARNLPQEFQLAGRRQ
jgi:hypothetical protein